MMLTEKKKMGKGGSNLLNLSVMSHNMVFKLVRFDH